MFVLWRPRGDNPRRSPLNPALITGIYTCTYCHDLGVNVDGAWTGYWFYRPLVHTIRHYKQLQSCC
jgi:hypothetical protein